MFVRRGVLQYALTTALKFLRYFKHRITNAALEDISNKIQSLIKKAYGYRNKDRFKNDILFHYLAPPFVKWSLIRRTRQSFSCNHVPRQELGNGVNKALLNACCLRLTPAPTRQPS